MAQSWWLEMERDLALRAGQNDKALLAALELNVELARERDEIVAERDDAVAQLEAADDGEIAATADELEAATRASVRAELGVDITNVSDAIARLSTRLREL